MAQDDTIVMPEQCNCRFFSLLQSLWTNHHAFLPLVIVYKHNSFPKH